MSTEVLKQKEKWQHYLFLTKELLRVAKEEDILMIETLLEEKDKLQKEMERWEEQLFLHSTEGENLRSELMILNKKVTFALQRNANHLKNAMNISNAYGSADAVLTRGNFMDFGG